MLFPNCGEMMKNPFAADGSKNISLSLKGMMVRERGNLFSREKKFALLLTVSHYREQRTS